MRNKILKYKKFITNKLFLYLFSRYFTYFIQFLTSILIAVNLGPYYLGIWGFLLLLINSFNITNFGVSNSLNILMVQYKNDEVHVKNLVMTSFVLIGAICFLVVMIAIYYYLFGVPFFGKYEIGNLFFAVCMIAMFAYVNRLMVIIYRVNNGLFEIAFFQTIIPLLVLVSLFMAKGRSLLIVLLTDYLLGHVLSFILFIRGRLLPRGGKSNWSDVKLIIQKSSFLFMYNICFYFIISSTKAIASIFYPVKEYGYFVFSYTLANSILLFLEAVSFVIFPKIIDKLHSSDVKKIEKTMLAIRANYVSLSHGLIYVAMIAFPILLEFIPRYKNTVLSINLISLTIMLYTNAFGFNSYLMAQNKEKTIAIISALSLFVNISIGLILACVLKVTYEYIIIATMISYMIYSFLCVYHGKLLLFKQLSFSSIIHDFFPANLLIPYLTAIVVFIIHSRFIFIPFVTFIILNVKNIKEILNTTKKMILKPDFIDIVR